MGVQSNRKVFLEDFIVQAHYARMGQKTTICCLTLYNGFEVVGTSAPADLTHFKQDLGELYAYEAALEELDGYFAFLQQERAYIERQARLKG